MTLGAYERIWNDDVQAIFAAVVSLLFGSRTWRAKAGHEGPSDGSCRGQRQIVLSEPPILFSDQTENINATQPLGSTNIGDIRFFDFVGCSLFRHDDERRIM